MAEASEKKLLTKGIFIPTGLHLMEGKEVVTNILLAHEDNTKRLIGLPLNGMTQEEMKKRVPKTNKTVEETIREVEGVISVEKMGGYQYSNKWLLVLKREKEKDVQKQLSENIEIMYKSQSGQARMITAGTYYAVKQNTKRTEVGTYAEILMKQYLPTEKQQKYIEKDTYE